MFTTTTDGFLKLDPQYWVPAQDYDVSVVMFEFDRKLSDDEIDLFVDAMPDEFYGNYEVYDLPNTKLIVWFHELRAAEFPNMPFGGFQVLMYK